MSAGGGMAAVDGANFLYMSVAELRNECHRLNISFPSNALKSVLQDKLRLHHDQLNRECMAQLAKMQQREQEQMKDADIDDEDAVKCTICYEEYSDLPTRTPRLLPCGHTFCTDCVKSFIGLKAPNRIECPTCKQQSNIPVLPVINIDECPVAKHVPVNFYAKEASGQKIISACTKSDIHTDLRSRQDTLE